MRSVESVAASRDGARIVSGSSDGTVRVWNVLREKTSMEVLRGHEGPVISVTISRNNLQIVSASRFLSVSGACQPRSQRESSNATPLSW